MPRTVRKVVRQREVEVWDEHQVVCFLEVSADHRLGGPIRVETLYGLRRSELLALRWSKVDFDEGTVRIDAGLVNPNGTPRKALAVVAKKSKGHR